MMVLHSDRFPNSYYKKIGNGPVLVLVHGFGEDHHIWKHQEAFLQESFTLLLPDLPGSGLSALPKETMSMNLLADFIAEIVAQEGLDQIQLFGHSMGGYTALAFAERYPSKLRSLGLIHSSAFADDEEKKLNRSKSIHLIQWHENGKEVFLKAMVPNLYAEDALQRIPGLIEEHLTTALKIPSESLVAYYQAMIDRPDRTSVLKTMHAMVLFVLGDQDKAVPLQAALEQTSMPQRSAVVIGRNTGHTSMNENPQLLNNALINFAYDVLTLQLT